MSDKQRYHQARKVTLIGAVTNAFLGFIKVIFGVVGHSSALLADGIHSLSDLLTDVLVIIASKYGSQAADDSHPYGHQRIETAATMFLSLFLIIVGVGIVVDGMRHLFHTVVEPLDVDVIGVIVLSIIANELLFRYTRHVGEKIESPLIIANAWHHRSDAVSSLVVFVGVVGSLLGYHHLDSIAASIVGLMIIKMGWTLGWNSVTELVDTGVDSNTLSKMESVIINCTGVVALHQLRTRSMGGGIFVDVHVLVGERLSVSEGHHIAQNVACALRNNVELIADVTVHVDPEDDEIANPCTDLPSRSEIVSAYEKDCLGIPGYSSVIRTHMHYLDGRVLLELYFPEMNVDTKAIETIILRVKEVHEVRFYKEIKT